MAASTVSVRRPVVLAVGARHAGIAGAALITLAAGALRLGFAFKSITPNPFYDAAVRSMALSWHNFFYGAFEPGGSVSIDKAPADLWFQVASVKLLGFSSRALRLPEALAGTAAIPLLYALVARLFGRAAGLIAAAALAVMPVAVVTARSDTMDSLMMALLVAAALLAVRAAQADRTPIAAGLVLGLAFNVKLFEAVVPLPAIAVLFVLVATRPLAVRLKRLAAGSVVYAAAALSWVAAAGLASPGSRPYPIGSSNGGVWNVVFWFNGIGRLGGAPNVGAVDPAGPTRLFGAKGTQYGSLIGTELLGAVALGAVALIFAWPWLTATRARRAGAIGLGLWLVLGAGLFSAVGRLHPRYLEAVTPAVAATLGIATVALARAAPRRRATAAAFGATVVAVVLVDAGFARAQPGTHIVAVLGAAACALVAATAASARVPRLVPFAAVLATFALLAMPLGTALRLARMGATDSGRPGYERSAQTIALSRFLQSHTRGMRYELASSTPTTVGPLIARDARPVMMLTVPYGRQLTPPEVLARAVARGQLRYALIAPSKCPRCIPSIRWARQHGTDVSRQARLPRGSLYRLSPRARAHASGNSSVNAAPSTLTVPPWRRAIIATIGSPSPEPGRSRLPAPR